jgi:hypothetical protein
MSAADWELLAREGANYSNAVFGRLRERSEAREERAREERERYEEGVARFAGWDAAAEHSAVRDALLAELARLDPANPLLNPAMRKDIGAKGRGEYVRNGRNDFADTYIVSRGRYRIR